MNMRNSLLLFVFGLYSSLYPAAVDCLNTQELFFLSRLSPQTQTALILARCSTLCLTASTERTSTLSSESTPTLDNCVSLRTSIETRDRQSTTSSSKLKIQWVDGHCSWPLLPLYMTFYTMMANVSTFQAYKLQPLHLSISHIVFFPALKCQGGLSAQTYVHIEVKDLNDNAPVFNPDEYTVSISSHTQPGAEIINVIATDRDSGRFGQVSYDILPGDVSSLFALEKQTGRQACKNTAFSRFCVVLSVRILYSLEGNKIPGLT